ncbi:MAG: sulfurtransferase [Candidatus Thiodiazotropha sp.]
MTDTLPLLIEPDALRANLDDPRIAVIDLGRDTTYPELHIPGAIHLPYTQITSFRHPVYGLLPAAEQLEPLFSSLGIGPDTHVVAYDDEGGGNASRLLWTLQCMGHDQYSLLNGGLHAWANEGNPCSRTQATREPAVFRANPDDSVVADADYILSRLDAADVALWDARSVQEYRGISRFSQYPGHIPGAVNLDWLEVMVRQTNMRLKPESELLALLTGLGFTPDKEVITYCQTHHRSSLTWFVLRLLGYKACKGYPGSWSDWGNRDDTPKALP